MCLSVYKQKRSFVVEEINIVHVTSVAWNIQKSYTWISLTMYKVFVTTATAGSKGPGEGVAVYNWTSADPVRWKIWGEEDTSKISSTFLKGDYTQIYWKKLYRFLHLQAPPPPPSTTTPRPHTPHHTVFFFFFFLFFFSTWKLLLDQITVRWLFGKSLENKPVAVPKHITLLVWIQCTIRVQ